MKKLKLYGSTNLAEGADRENAVAVVYVTDKKELVVESPHLDVKRDIEEALVALIKRGGPIIKRCSEENIKDGKAFSMFGEHRNLGDSDFLEALRGELSFWSRKFGGYEINPLVSGVVEE